MTQLTLTQCSVLYEDPEDKHCDYPDMANTVRTVFPPRDADDLSAFCQLMFEHEVGAYDGMYLSVQKHGKHVLTLELNNMCEVDALRRFCEMILIHNSYKPDVPQPG